MSGMRHLLCSVDYVILFPLAHFNTLFLSLFSFLFLLLLSLPSLHLRSTARGNDDSPNNPQRHLLTIDLAALQVFDSK